MLGIGIVLRWTSVLALAAMLLVLFPSSSPAISPTDLPPSLQALSISTLLNLFVDPFGQPNLAAEIARQRAWIAPEESGIETRLAKVISDYPGTADARHALLDIGGVYARRRDWVKARAPFLYVMDIKQGQPAARIASLQMVEMYRYTGAPPGTDILTECRAALAGCKGTSEEGLARLLLADILAERGSYTESFDEFEELLAKFPRNKQNTYMRIRYALDLVNGKRPDRALEVVGPALDDPIWGGRAHFARGRANEDKKLPEAAMADFQIAAHTAESLWYRGEGYLGLSRLYAAKGQFREANDSLLDCLSVSPFRDDRRNLLLRVVRNSRDAGDFPAAAGMAMNLSMEAQNEKWRYPADALAHTVGVCDEILDQCEKALAVGKSNLLQSAKQSDDNQP